VRLQDAISTLRYGINTILNCDVPYDQMDAALKLVEEKFTSTNSKSIRCCPNCNTDYDVGIFNVCENCGHRWH